MTTPQTAAARRRLVIRRIRITGWTALSSLITAIIGFLTWAHVVYVADREATLEVFRSGAVSVEDRDRAIILTPLSADAAQDTAVMVFYPGARVDPYSYLPPLAEISDATGLRVVIARVALNLALTDTREVIALASLAGNSTDIIVSGHSLGGVQACMRAEETTVSHLILWASFCANDLTQRDGLRVLTLLGSEDGLTDVSQVNDASALLPPGELKVTIEGANHASFGAYGPQTGDGVATLSRDDFTERLVSEITDFLAAEGRD